jgi:uncharacterized protein
MVKKSIMKRNKIDLFYYRYQSVLMIFILLICVGSTNKLGSKKETFPINSVPYNKVKVTGGFWLQMLQRNDKITIHHNWNKCDETGRIANFYIASKKKEGAYSEHHTSADSDVFKTIDGIARSLAQYPDTAWEHQLDDFVAVLAQAQENDGYLYTPRTIDSSNPPKQAGQNRWDYLVDSHELYNVGHLYEAAISYYESTGKTNLLDVALKNADFLCETFGSNKKHDIPGHQEIEIGLVKLYNYSGKQKYLDLAKFFLQERGMHDNNRPIYTYNDDSALVQDHLPIIAQTEARGHAVRFGYQAAAMVDVAMLTHDTTYLNTLNLMWNDVVGRKMYLTGGIGSRQNGESFEAPYYLPNKNAYAETCAGIANMLWQYRMFLVHGDSKYLDVMERVIYNGILSSPNVGGDEFFYVNPLSSSNGYKRKPWYGVPCCPTNIGRTIPSISGYAFAQSGDNIYVNFFMDCKTQLQLSAKNSVSLVQQTKYPYEGKVTITINPEKNSEFELRIRIPGWAMGKPVPTDLYRYLNDEPLEFSILVNNKPVSQKMEKGFAVIKKRWKKGDAITLNIAMPIRRVLSNPKVEGNLNKVALERGPLLFCFEDVDNKTNFEKLTLSNKLTLDYQFDNQLMGGTPVIKGDSIMAIPYFKWANRGGKAMDVWINCTD